MKKIAIAATTFACAALFSVSYSDQSGVSLGVQGAQAAHAIIREVIWREDMYAVLTQLMPERTSRPAHRARPERLRLARSTPQAPSPRHRSAVGDGMTVAAGTAAIINPALGAIMNVVQEVVGHAAPTQKGGLYRLNRVRATQAAAEICPGPAGVV
jgi:hypothetical protein